MANKKWTIKKEKQKLEALLQTLDPLSQEYSTILERLEKLTRADANENSWKGPVLVQAVGTGVSTTINAVTGILQIRQITKSEVDGHPITSKSLGFAHKAR